MKNPLIPSYSIFSLGMILVLSACSLSGSGSMEAETPTPEMDAATLPPDAEEQLDPAAEEPREPNPALIDISLEEDAAISASIGPEGGSIQTMDANGTMTTLTIPEGALFSTVEIIMTPIASAEGESIGETFLAGVALQPENLHFLELVTIEIAGDTIEEGTTGFSSQSSGQDFHLTPSQFASGSLIITATHFSEYGVSQEELLNLLDSIAPVAETAIIEHGLVLGSDQQALSALGRMIESIRNAGSIASFEAWEPWTANVVNLTLRLEEVIESRGWDENTPGLTDILGEMQGLIDQWFQQSEGVVQALADKCVQGEIEVFPRIRLIREVGSWINKRLKLEREEEFNNWASAQTECFNLGVTWQANVVTTSNNFFSDISVGSQVPTGDVEVTVSSTDPPTFIVSKIQQTPLEVEYIDGFWHINCVGAPGVVELGFAIVWQTADDYFQATDFISSISGYVSIREPVDIDCSPAGINVTAKAQEPFHGGALDELNKGRVGVGTVDLGEGLWEFKLKYNPGGGEIARFEEGPKNLSFPDGEYKLWQLISIYQGTPAN